jgi:hypothetical protein
MWAMRAKLAGSWLRTHKILGAWNPVKAGLPAISMRRWAPMRCVISAHSAACALVVPEQGWADNLIIGIRKNQPCISPGQANTDDLGGIHGAGDFTDGLLGALPPIAGILLAPEGVRARDGVFGQRHGDDAGSHHHRQLLWHPRVPMSNPRNNGIVFVLLDYKIAVVVVP